MQMRSRVGRGSATSIRTPRHSHILRGGPIPPRAPHGTPQSLSGRRFLILPWVKVRHLASKILALNLRRLVNDWERVWNHPIFLAETFVDTSRYRGTCYRAAKLAPSGPHGRPYETRQPVSVWGDQEVAVHLPSSSTCSMPPRRPRRAKNAVPQNVQPGMPRIDVTLAGLRQLRARTWPSGPSTTYPGPTRSASRPCPSSARPTPGRDQLESKNHPTAHPLGRILFPCLRPYDRRTPAQPALHRRAPPSPVERPGRRGARLSLPVGEAVVGTNPIAASRWPCATVAGTEAPYHQARLELLWFQLLKL